MSSLPEIARLFFKLGLIAFGGPAAHIAMMEEEVVSKRRWMTRDHFLDLVGATNLIPGPNSTEMAIHCGFHRGGWPGLIIAGVCFIFPAVTITGILAALYAAYGTLPAVEPFIYGIRPAVIAVIFGAVVKLGQKAVKTKSLLGIGLAVMAVNIAGLSEIFAILGGGVIGAIWLNLRPRLIDPGQSAAVLPFWPKLLPVGGLATVTAVTVLSLPQLFLSFLKIGSILFGSGYVLIAYLEGEFVQRLGWLSSAQILDAVAIGQFTPGPVLSTSTFIGYQLQGISGAALATLGIFLPSFVFVALLNPLIPRLRRSAWASRFLDAVNASAVGIMAAVTAQLTLAAAGNWKTGLIAAAAIVISLARKNVSAVWLVAGGSLAGYLLSWV